jgi:hypothetical protein
MTLGNLIYLAQITSRVAVIPPFIPDSSHMGSGLGPIEAVPFGTIFDLPYFRNKTGTNLIEWRDLKTGYDRDYLACWTNWVTAGDDPAHQPRYSQLWDGLALGAYIIAEPRF